MWRRPPHRPDVALGRLLPLLDRFDFQFEIVAP
jgi:hypothetical protein